MTLVLFCFTTASCKAHQLSPVRECASWPLRVIAQLVWDTKASELPFPQAKAVVRGTGTITKNHNFFTH